MPRTSQYGSVENTAGDDYLFGVDVSDTSMSENGTNKRFKLKDLPLSTAMTAALAEKADAASDISIEDGGYSAKIYAGFSASEAISKWDLVYPDADGGIAVSDNSVADGAGRAFFLATADADVDASVTLIREGFVRDDTWEWTPQATLYLSTVGGITETAPTDSGATVQPVGIAITATTIYVDIDGIHGWGIAA